MPIPPTHTLAKHVPSVTDIQCKHKLPIIKKNVTVFSKHSL